MGLPRFIATPDPKIYLSDKWICLDIETTNKNKGDAVDGDNSFVYGYFSSSFCGSGDINTGEELEALAPRFNEADFIVVQGGKFELKWFKRFEIDISRILIYDTLLGEYVIAGNRKFSLGLDAISKRYGGLGKASLVSKLIHSGVCPSNIPRGLLVEYCRQDVHETIRVFQLQRKVLHDAGLLPVFFLRCITTPVLADIESNGIFLDRDSVLKVYQDTVRVYVGVSQKLHVITGGINMASPQQVAEFLYGKLEFDELTDRRGNPIRGKANKKFPSGQPLTDEPTLEKLVATTPLQREFLSLKGEGSRLRKKITSYLERYMYVCGHEFQPLTDKIKVYSDVKGSCTLHGKLNQSISQTHRLTSSNPNLQNIDKSLKRVVTARKKGNWIRNADYKTLEFTVAGILSQDKQIREDIEGDADIHAYTASILFAKEWAAAGASKISARGKEIRDSSKADTFGPLYGKTSGSKAQQRYYAAFREKYNTCHTMQQNWVYEALKTKKLRTVTGLTFYFPDTQMQASGYITNSNSIFNYPIQMFATADLAPTAVCLLWHHMKAMGLKSFIINEVHDSVLIEESDDEREIVGNLVENCMSKYISGFIEQVIGYKINFPLTVEQASDSHWGFQEEDN